MAQADPSLSSNLDVPIIPRYPSIVTPVANHLARREIERQWRAKGLRIQRYADVIAQARAYLAEHEEELFAQAMEIVRTSPRHRAWAEREERERERQWRKSARNGVLEKPLAPPCLSIRSAQIAH
jgi:hypothetical protein